MLPRFLPVALALLLWLASPLSGLAADLWIGSCHNVTANMGGNLKLYVDDDSGILTGYISISGWLTGSGAINGRRHGNRFEFDSIDSLQGIVITWKGLIKNDGRIIGEYTVLADPARNITRQIGEWSLSLHADSVEKVATTEDRFKKLFIFELEREFNAPLTMNDGVQTTGTAILFAEVHPMGTPVSTTVDSVQIEWLDPSQGFARENLHRYRIEITLHWHGLIRTFGKTRMAVTYNAQLGEFTGQEILSTNGVTNRQAQRTATAVGAIIAKAALDALASSP